MSNNVQNYSLRDRSRQIDGQAFVTRCGQSQAGNGVAISVMKGRFDDTVLNPHAEPFDLFSRGAAV
jgi:hypothetical protein